MENPKLNLSSFEENSITKNQLTSITGGAAPPPPPSNGGPKTGTTTTTTTPPGDGSGPGTLVPPVIPTPK